MHKKLDTYWQIRNFTVFARLHTFMVIIDYIAWLSQLNFWLQTLNGETWKPCKQQQISMRTNIVRAYKEYPENKVKNAQHNLYGSIG